MPEIVTHAPCGAFCVLELLLSDRSLGNPQCDSNCIGRIHENISACGVQIMPVHAREAETNFHQEQSGSDSTAAAGPDNPGSASSMVEQDTFVFLTTAENTVCTSPEDAELHAVYAAELATFGQSWAFSGNGLAEDAGLAAPESWQDCTNPAAPVEPGIGLDAWGF